MESSQTISLTKNFLNYRYITGINCSSDLLGSKLYICSTVISAVDGCLQDAYEELVLMVGSRRSSLNHGLSLKAQYETALHDLTNLVDTAQDKMAADQKMTVTSVIEVQMLLDKNKVRKTVASRLCFH